MTMIIYFIYFTNKTYYNKKVNHPSFFSFVFASSSSSFISLAEINITSSRAGYLALVYTWCVRIVTLQLIIGPPLRFHMSSLFNLSTTICSTLLLGAPTLAIAVRRLLASATTISYIFWICLLLLLSSLRRYI